MEVSNNGRILTNCTPCLLSIHPESQVYLCTLLATAAHSWTITILSEVTETHFNLCFFQMSPSQMAFSRRERWRAIYWFSLSSSLLLPFSSLHDPFLIFLLISSLFSHTCSWLYIYHCRCVSLKKKKENDTSVTKQDPFLAFMFGNHILEYSSWTIGLNYLCFSVCISVCSRLNI